MFASAESELYVVEQFESDLVFPFLVIYSEGPTIWTVNANYLHGES